MKRIVSFLLALFLIVPCLVQLIPAPAAAATSTEQIRAVVAKKFDELRARTNPAEGGGEGVVQLINHAISGGGQELIMDESDYFTGMAFHSNMYRDAFIDTLTAAFERLLKSHDQKMLISNSVNYYDHKKSYSASSVSQFVDFKDPGEHTEGIEQSLYRLESLVNVKAYPGTYNTYDNGMILVVGGGSNRFTIEKTGASDNSVTYHVFLRFRDNFDITKIDYSGKKYDKEDVKLANTIALLGKILEYGGFIDIFQFGFDIEFDISVGNDCTHTTRDFAWEFNGTDLVSVSGNGLATNAAEHIDHYNSTGEYANFYYKLDHAIDLKHDRPWALEFKCKSTRVVLGQKSTNSGTPYIAKTGEAILVGQSFKYESINQETGKNSALTGQNRYGVNFKEVGISNSKTHVYRLENRISGGSNMVYLIVDGQELGPMTSHYVVKSSTTELQANKSDWINGKDIQISYLFNQSTRFNPKNPVEYIKVWENGEGNGAYSYYTTSQVAPTCTGKGYTAHICMECGDTWADNYVDAKSHQYGAFTPSDDIMHVQSCTVCGEKHAEAHTWGAPQVNGMQIAYQCTVCKHVKVETLDKAGIQGKWSTDLVMHAADLGVSAPDAVLRCTFDFQKNGSVSTSWAAGDLTALRLYFRDMFVSAYYAMAYGSGITDLQQVEETCIASTGMGVTAYMDSIVTIEAITAAFTPAADSGMYMVNEHGNAVYLDLNFMGISSDLGTPNAYTVKDGTMHMNAASFGKPEYTFVCKRVN